MRKLKWNGVSLFSALFLALFATIFSFLLTENASAVSPAQFTSYWRSYYIVGSGGVVNQSSFDSEPGTSQVLLQYIPGENSVKQLKGFSIDFDVNDTTQYQHKTLVVKLTLFQMSPVSNIEPRSTLNRNIPNVLAVNTTSGEKFVANKCSSAYSDHNGNPSSAFVTYTCSMSWDDFASLYNVQLSIGTIRNATTNSPNVGWVGPLGNSSYNPQSGTISAYWLSYDLTGSTDPSYTNIVNISSGVDQLVDQNQTIINQNEQIISSIQDQSHQQQDQYDQEKQEEQDRENQGNEDADQMAGLFDFTFVNPFYFLAAGFTPGNTCVSIPTIAGMLNTDQTTFCPFFSQETRNIVTPVLTLFAMVILFGFLIGWLNGGDMDGTIKVKGRG